MQKYVALLRGINVGGRIVKMVDLKQCFESLGLTDVVTVLQSGNVIFSASNTTPAALQHDLESAVGTRFNYPAKIQVYSQDTVREAVADYPFEPREGYHDYVIFLDADLVQELMAFESGLNPDEKIAAGKQVIYWTVAKGSTLKTDFSKVLTKVKFKEFNTIRNINTLQKLI